MTTIEIIALIISLIKIAAKEGPEVFAAVQDFIKKLAQTEFTEAELEALRITKPPEDYFPPSTGEDPGPVEP